MSKSVLIRRTSLGKLIIKLGMAIVILLIPVSSYSLPYQSPRTQNVEQTNVPDYISQAEAGVKKYYPQYEEYFKPIFSEINGLDKAYLNIINNNINRIIKNSKEIGTSERDIYTTILMTIEKLAGGNTFCSDNNIANNIEDKNTKEGVAEGIIYFIKEGFEKKNKDKNIAIEKQKKINEGIKRLLAKDTLTREDKEELLNIIEELYNLIENTEYYNDKRNKFIFEEYIKRSKDIGRSPKKEIVEWLKKNE